MLILHGNNIVASRQALTEQKQKARRDGCELVELRGKDLDLTGLKQALESLSLFGQERLVIIEGLFSLPQSKLKEKVLTYLKAEDPKASLIIWEGKQIDGRVLRGLAKKAKIVNHKLSPLIFRFLDSFQINQPQLVLNLFHQTIEAEAPELVFYLLARRIKNLIMAKDLGKNGLTKMAPWQQSRLLAQSGKFSLDRLVSLHQNLLQIEWQQKTGQDPFRLAHRLELLMASL